MTTTESNGGEAAQDEALSWEQDEAADALGGLLDKMRDVRQEMDRYAYSYPPHLVDERNATRRKIRDAVRTLCRDADA